MNSLEPVGQSDEISQYNENGNLVSVLIEDLELTSPDKPYSFVRCDFRQSQILKSRFRQTDFTNSDFVGTVIKSCEFRQCNFMSTAFSSCVIQNAVFSQNRNLNADMIDVTFENCTFRDQLIDRAVWRNSRLFAVRWEDVTVNRSTIENCHFEDCSLEGMNLLSNYFVGCTFVRCDLRGVSFDVNSFGTHVFRECDLSNVKVKFKDQHVPVSPTTPRDLKQLADYYRENNRPQEYFATYLLSTLNAQQGIDCYPVDILSDCLKMAISSEPLRFAEQQIVRLLRLVDTDLKLGLLQTKQILELELVSRQLEEDIYDSWLRSVFVSGCANVRNTADRLSLQDIHVAPSETSGTLTFTFQTDDECKAVEFTKHLFAKFFNEEAFEVVEVKRGSIVIEVLSYTSCIVVVASALRHLLGSSLQLYVDYKSTKATVRLIEKAKSPKVLKEIHETRVISSKISHAIAADDQSFVQKLSNLRIKL